MGAESVRKGPLLTIVVTCLSSNVVREGPNGCVAVLCYAVLLVALVQALAWAIDLVYLRVHACVRIFNKRVTSWQGAG